MTAPLLQLLRLPTNSVSVPQGRAGGWSPRGAFCRVSAGQVVSAARCTHAAVGPGVEEQGVALI